MLSVRRFRLHPDEAVRLNVSDSVHLKPGDDLAVITGVLHNLHCLVKWLPPPFFTGLAQRSNSSARAEEASAVLALSGPLLPKRDSRGHQ